jgi:hypothetical protein
MSGDKGSRRLVKFWWVLASITGAGAGAAAAATQGLSNTIWAIGGVGLPLLAIVGILEWAADRPTTGVRPRWRAVRRPAVQAQPRTYGSKLAPRRAQLHAIAGRKTAEPPSSGGS